MADVFGTFRKSSPWRTFLELFGNQEWLPLSDVFETFRTSSPWWTFLELSRNQAWLPLGDVFRTFRKSSVAPLADFLKLCGNRTLTDIFGTFQKLSVAPPGGRFWNFFGKPNRHDLRSQICCRIGQCSRNFIAYFETTYIGRKKRKGRSDPRCRC